MSNEKLEAGLTSHLTQELDVPKKKKTIPEMLRQENREFSLEIKKLNFEVKRLGALLEKEKRKAKKVDIKHISDLGIPIFEDKQINNE